MIKKIVFGLVLVFSGLSFSAQAGEPLNINSASAEVIERELAGVGAVKAQSIVKYRQENGPFTSVDDLAKVSGIGDKTLAKIRGQVIVSDGDEAK